MASTCVSLHAVQRRGGGAKVGLRAGPHSSRSLAHMSWVGLGGWRCLSRWLYCYDTSAIHVMLHSSPWCWTDIESMLLNALGHNPMDQWRGRAPGGAKRCHHGTGWRPLWALPLLATWMASRRLGFARLWLFCPCNHNSPNTCGTK